MKIYRTTLLAFLIATLFSLQLKAQNTALSKPVNTVIDNYLALKNALVNNDGNLAAAKGKLLLASVNEVPKTGLSADKVTLLEKLEYDSRHISEVPRVAHQREHFASLSKNLFTLVKGLKLNKQALYWEYCVMKSTYYISESTNGKDPYMGMANCSKVKATLPAIK